MSMFVLQNARGELVDILNDDLLAYTPTGLGTVFTNTYSQYDNYFKATKVNVQQGQMSINILFGDIESHSYQTFTQFATFLAYQPLTLIYTTSAGTWKREARLNALTKTEIGGGNFATDRLNEQFTLDFINPWYNNKEGIYKSYDYDSNLAVFGKGFFNELGNANRNYILNSSGENATASTRPNLTGGLNVAGSVNSSLTYNSDSIQLSYTGTGTTEWYYSLADSWSNMSDTVLSFDNTYTLSVEVKGTAPGAMLRVSDTFSTPVKITNTGWTRLTYTFKFPNISGNNLGKFYIRLNASNGTDTNATGFVKGQTLSFRHFKLEEGTVATDWITAPEDGQTDMNMLYTYGYMGVAYDGDSNKPYVDEAQADITEID